MPNTAKEDKIYTIEDIEALPEGERAELIDGKIYYMSSPSRIHQRISMSISTDINNYIKANKGSCEVYAAPFAVYLNNKNNTNYFEPDISVICDPTKLDEKGCHGAPDWIIEIVSLGSATMDRYIKLLKYSDAGVKEYWIVDSVKEEVTVYKTEKKEMENYTFDDNIPVGIYNNFSLKIEL